MWTPSVRTFQIMTALCACHWIFYLVDAHWPLWSRSADEEAALQWAGIDAWVPADRGRRIWYLIHGTLAVSFTAMIRLHDWARWTALIAIVLDAVSPAIFGLGVAPMIQTLIYSIGWTLSDFTLAIAFLTPVALRFNGDAIEERAVPEEDG